MIWFIVLYEQTHVGFTVVAQQQHIDRHRVAGYQQQSLLSSVYAESEEAHDRP